MFRRHAVVSSQKPGLEVGDGSVRVPQRLGRVFGSFHWSGGVLATGLLQSLVPAPPIGADRAAKLDIRFDERNQAAGRDVRQGARSRMRPLARPRTSRPPRRAFLSPLGDRSHPLPCRPRRRRPPLWFREASHDPVERRFSQLVEHGPSRLIAHEAELPLKLQRGYPWASASSSDTPHGTIAPEAYASRASPCLRSRTLDTRTICTGRAAAVANGTRLYVCSAGRRNLRASGSAPERMCMPPPSRTDAGIPPATLESLAGP